MKKQGKQQNPMGFCCFTEPCAWYCDCGPTEKMFLDTVVKWELPFRLKTFNEVLLQFGLAHSTRRCFCSIFCLLDPATLFM